MIVGMIDRCARQMIRTIYNSSLSSGPFILYSVYSGRTGDQSCLLSQMEIFILSLLSLQLFFLHRSDLTIGSKDPRFQCRGQPIFKISDNNTSDVKHIWIKCAYSLSNKITGCLNANLLLQYRAGYYKTPETSAIFGSSTLPTCFSSVPTDVISGTADWSSAGN